MDKINMREWVASLEEVLDNKLRKWKKNDRIENGEAIQLHWQFVQTHIKLDIFWEDKKELIVLAYGSPRANHEFKWHGLTDQTFNRIMDRVGNLAQTITHPPIEPPFAAE